MAHGPAWQSAYGRRALAWCDERIAQHARDNADVRAAAQLIGIGPVGASAAVATVDDFKQFKSGAQFSAWCGVVARQHSSGGKAQLGRITRRGDSYLRSPADPGREVGGAHGAQTLRSDQPLGARAARALELADRGGGAGQQNARILWAVMIKGRRFDPNHISVKPGAPPAVTTA
jgi:transposase